MKQFMYDKEYVAEILQEFQKAVLTIIERFKPVKKSSDFTNSPNGMEKLDSICMLLIAIGESLKKVDKITNEELLLNYKSIDWKKVKGLRDVISHQYFDINAEAIFNVCKDKIKPLYDMITQMISDLKN